MTDDDAAQDDLIELARLPRRDEQVEVHIEALDVRGGTGLGRWSVLLGPQREPRELTVAVRKALPGERVRARVEKVRRGVVTAAMTDLLEPSPDRIAPRCIHFGRREIPGQGCGGCTLQSLPYARQLAHKQQLVERSLRDAGVDLSGVDVRPILGMDEPWHYRNKMEFSFGRTREGEFSLGLHPGGYRHEVIALEQCWLESPEAIALVREVRRLCIELGLEPYHGRSNTGWLRTLTLREGKRTGERLLLLTTTHDETVTTAEGALDSPAAARRLIDEVLAFAEGASIRIDSVVHARMRAVRGERTTLELETLHGTGLVHEALALPGGEQLRFEVHPLAFFQPNTRQAEVLYGEVIAAAHEAFSSGARVLDLYCGTGTIGLCMAPYVAQVTGVELQPDAVDNARRNAAHNGLSNVEFIAGDVGEVLGGELAEVVAAGAIDLVVVDPPRAGLLPEAHAHLATLAPPRLVYVSCNPQALGRDLARLVAQGYAIVSVQPVDMFPQTAHVETVVSLRRAS